MPKLATLSLTLSSSSTLEAVAPWEEPYLINFNDGPPSNPILSFLSYSFYQLVDQIHELRNQLEENFLPSCREKRPRQLHKTSYISSAVQLVPLPRLLPTYLPSVLVQ